jgi:Rod binding domain-containing protein
MDPIAGISPDLATVLPLDAAAPKAGAANDRKAIEKTSKDFESVLLYQMLAEMRRSVDDAGLLEDSGNEQVQSMFWYGMAQELSAKGGLGLWRQLSRQMQAMESPPAKPTISEKV